MKKKKTIIISACAVIAVCVFVVLLVCLPGGKKEAVKPTETDTEAVTEEVAVSIDTPTSETEPVTEEVKEVTPEKEDAVITVAEQTGAVTAKSSATKVKAADTTASVKKTAPAETVKVTNENKGVVIGNAPETTAAYSCGASGHHCDGPETHAFISNLELEGCPYCGSHSCPSFYKTDSWGHTCYTPSACPSYNKTSDSAAYCQNCHKISGDGSNGTCATFNVDINCPLCGEFVKAWECHTCK